MGNVKWILVCGVLMAALSVNVAAEGPKSDMGVFFDSHGTTGYAATMATLVMAVGSEIAPADGHISQDLDTAISVSNTCKTPVGEGFPMCGVGPDGMSGDVGAVWLFCYPQGVDDVGVGGPPQEVLTFDSSAVDPVIGTGLNEDGELEAGGTWTVYFSDVLRAVGVPTEDQSFIGYCYVVGEFDAIVGSTVNFINTLDPPLQQDFSMQADMEGVDVFVGAGIP